MQLDQKVLCEKFSNNVQSRLKKRKLSLVALLSALNETYGLSVGTQQPETFLAADRLPDVTILLAVSDYLHTDIYQLLGLEPAENSRSGNQDLITPEIQVELDRLAAFCGPERATNALGELLKNFNQALAASRGAARVPGMKGESRS